MPVDKLGNEVKKDDTVAFVYHGSSNGLKIGKVFDIKEKTRKGVKDNWLYIRVVGIAEREYEGLQWTRPQNTIKLKEEMMDDILLAKLSQTTPGDQENTDLLPKEKIEQVKQAFLSRGAVKVRLRTVDWKQKLQIEFDDKWGGAPGSQSKFRQLADEISNELGLPEFEFHGWWRHYTIRLNP